MWGAAAIPAVPRGTRGSTRPTATLRQGLSTLKRVFPLRHLISICCICWLLWGQPSVKPAPALLCEGVMPALAFLRPGAAPSPARTPRPWPLACSQPWRHAGASSRVQPKPHSLPRRDFPSPWEMKGEEKPFAAGVQAVSAPAQLPAAQAEGSGSAEGLAHPGGTGYG